MRPLLNAILFNEFAKQACVRLGSAYPLDEPFIIATKDEVLEGCASIGEVVVPLLEKQSSVSQYASPKGKRGQL